MYIDYFYRNKALVSSNFTRSHQQKVGLEDAQHETGLSVNIGDSKGGESKLEGQAQQFNLLQLHSDNSPVGTPPLVHPVTTQHQVISLHGLREGGIHS